MQAVVCEGKGTDMDGYTLSIFRQDIGKFIHAFICRI